MTSQHDRIQLLVRSPFWAILPERMQALVTMLLSESAPKWEAAKPSMLGKGQSRLALIPIVGTLTKDGPAWLGSNYDGITTALEQAAADSSVKCIVLGVDSPGGEVAGLPETGAMLAQVAKEKPVYAMVEGISASAAYWLTSQAQEIAATPSGEVGSVGVRIVHADISKMLENLGVKITELHAGDFKTEWSPFQPVSDAAKENMQARLNDLHTDFINTVAAGRGARATAAIQAKRFGEGRMFTTKEALGHGLIDKVMTAREYYRSILPQQEPAVSAPTPGDSYKRARLRVMRART